MKERLALIYWILIAILTVIGLLGVIPLVRSQLAYGDICPTIISIPACYIILGCLIFIIFHLFRLAKWGRRLFWIGTLIALAIATFGSISNMTGYAECPKTEGGTPMCYISFLLFLGITVLGFFEGRLIKLK